MKGKISAVPGALLAAAVSAWGLCSDKRDTGRLPPAIGAAGKPPAIFGLRCDTMVVPKGSSTVVYPGAFLYFEKEKTSNFIRVEGTLELRGDKDHHAVIAGGREPGPVLKPSETAAWAGIRIETGGELQMEFAEIHGAAFPITARSHAVKIEKSSFTGGMGIVMPDGTPYDLDPQFAAVELLDMANFQPAAAPVPEQVQEPKPMAAAKPMASREPVQKMSAEEKAALFAKKRKEPGFLTKPATWMIAGGGLALAAAGVFVQLQLEKKKSGGGILDPGMDPMPVTPQ